MWVKEVTFSGDAIYPIGRDDGSGTYATPHWQDNTNPPDGDADDAGDRRFPVAYTRNTYMKVSATLVVEPPEAFGGSIVVRGDGPGAYDFQDTTTLSGNELTITNVQALEPLANEVDFMNPMTITWRVSRDGGQNWVGNARSENRIYITLADPIGQALESFFHIGTKASDGTDDTVGAVDAIWDEFADRAVHNARDERLGYYRGMLCASECTVYDAQGLVVAGNGQCGSWADLLMKCFGTQGIPNAELVTIEPDPEAVPPGCNNVPWIGFLVKNYAFAPGDGSTECASYPYRFNSPCLHPLFRNWPSETVEVTDLDGIPGQDESNPASWFSRHFIVKINEKYYDPSYGTGPYTGSMNAANLAWEQDAIAGYWGGARTELPLVWLGARQDIHANRETSFDR